jgi:Bacterial regulatory proteins, tetR family
LDTPLPQPSVAEHDQVLAAGQDFIDGDVLPGQPDAGAYPGCLAGHVEACDQGVPGIRAQQGRQDPDGGCLARPVLAQQAVHGALRYGQVQVIERRRVPEALAQALTCDRRISKTSLNSIHQEMPSEYSGSGRPSLSGEQIVAKAIELADRDGLGGLSMRRLAEELGITAMSLYGYVPSKAELLDVLADRAYGELAFHGESATPWRTRFAALAQQHWTILLSHPWLLYLSQPAAPGP